MSISIPVYLEEGYHKVPGILQHTVKAQRAHEATENEAGSPEHQLETGIPFKECSEKLEVVDYD